MFMTGAIEAITLGRFKVDLSDRSKEVDLSPSRVVAISQLVFAGGWLAFSLAFIPSFIGAPVYVMAFVALFPLLGIGILVGALNMLLRQRTVRFEQDCVWVRERRWFTTEEWYALYSDFEGVLWREHTRRSKKRSTTFQIIELKHPDAVKTLPLLVSTTKKPPRSDWNEYARKLGLSALRESGDDVVERSVDDLGKSLKDLSEENKVGAAWDPNEAVPNGLMTEPVNLPGGDGLKVTITAPIYPLVVKVLFYLSSSIFIAIGLVVPQAWMAAAAGGAYMVFIWLVFRQGDKASRFILLTRDKLTVHDSSKSKGKAERTFALDDIAGITVQRSRSGMGPELRIGSRKDEIPFGQGMSKDALDWLKRYLTAAIATA